MDKTKLELFKQALTEAVSNKFDNMAAGCTEEIVCSEKYNLAMRAIVYGKADTTRTWSPKMKRIVAILVAAALLLTSCGIIFRNEIREVFKEFFASITFDGDQSNINAIEEIYELGYLPDGYYLKEEKIVQLRVSYTFVNNNSNYIIFEQRIIDGTGFTIDSESGYSKINEIEKYTVYYRYTKALHSYIWNNDKYTFIIKSSTELSNEELTKIINGITVR